ncbi:kinase-like domain-containing protein [Rhizophagus irregularis DAOM 181602=DAOM 197198]|nr:kinase-like domain-containing protein [Rhizophagus irregularis DAOM 181602=DAOM 197198]
MSWNGYCEKCEVNTRSYWCKACNAKRFQQNFKNWTSGNNDIDKFIQDTQLSATHWSEVLEWIPYNKFYDIEYIAKGGFGKVYRAKWIDGQIERWDNENQNWRRFDSNMFVALKSLNNSENVTLEFINEIKLHSKIGAYTMNVIIAYGITQDPETKNYMMVLEYAENGSLRNYLNKNYSELDWENKLKNLLNIASGLEKIHENELTHRDLHIGNVLMNHSQTIITDMGLCKPADYKESESAKNKIYGVLPYISPEILRGQNYTKASDIYSFGIIMYEVISGLPPYHDVSHDENLAIKICQGLRPRFNIKVPQLIIHLIKRCLDANPLNRPTANEIEEILNQWYREFSNLIELQKQIKEAEEINHSLSTSSIPLTNLGLTYETHSEAVYTSRLLNFNNLPEPKNSDDYYDERNDNIISENFSESLQINISQLKISDAEETKNVEEMIE